ncbi:transporter substrate-binding domain-containing protein [Streptomyces sp. SP17BM10]|uniref:substrate-binding periplasmic protein n=1 Tax=Streptomyces sp. SP17BM10 TaxID=3002530 RepID=UPI002E791A5E|nr:transporter substrate-binding domain-containing protein [Streptomyces sp. SP17BM10]MEE1784569.1 transporter substrate-binding domain-containing protein [Streptomyces sp. SP17BM10]
MIAVRRLRMLAVAVAVVLPLVLVACSSGPVRPAPFDGTVRVGFKTAAPGMSVQDPNGIFRGFEPRLVAKVLGDAGVNYSSVPLSAQTWQDALLDGNTNHNGVDVVVADISDTADREQKFDLAGPYLKTPLGALLPAAASTIKVQRQEDLSGLRVCTIARTTARALIDNEVKPKVSVDALVPDDCLKALDDGTADVFVSDYLVLRGMAVNVKVNGQTPYVMAEGRFGRVQTLVAALPPGHTSACQWLRGRLDAYVKSQAWVTELRSNFNFGADVTDDNLRQEFQPLISVSDNLCAK